jgi:hypothetical protein
VDIYDANPTRGQKYSQIDATYWRSALRGQ